MLAIFQGCSLSNAHTFKKVGTCHPTLLASSIQKSLLSKLHLENWSGGDSSGIQKSTYTLADVQYFLSCRTQLELMKKCSGVLGQEIWSFGSDTGASDPSCSLEKKLKSVWGLQGDGCQCAGQVCFQVMASLQGAGAAWTVRQILQSGQLAKTSKPTELTVCWAFDVFEAPLLVASILNWQWFVKPYVKIRGYEAFGKEDTSEFCEPFYYLEPFVLNVRSSSILCPGE
eukprot:Gb_12968 [translate_table: standard]